MPCCFKCRFHPDALLFFENHFLQGIHCTSSAYLAGSRTASYARTYSHTYEERTRLRPPFPSGTFSMAEMSSAGSAERSRIVSSIVISRFKQPNNGVSHHSPHGRVKLRLASQSAHGINRLTAITATAAVCEFRSPHAKIIGFQKRRIPCFKRYSTGYYPVLDHLLSTCTRTCTRLPCCRVRGIVPGNYQVRQKCTLPCRPLPESQKHWVTEPLTIECVLYITLIYQNKHFETFFNSD